MAAGSGHIGASLTVSTRSADRRRTASTAAAGFSEEDAFAPVRTAFANVIENGGFAVGDPAIATDYVLGGVHAALVGATHSAAAERRKVADEIASLAARTLR